MKLKLYVLAIVCAVFFAPSIAMASANYFNATGHTSTTSYAIVDDSNSQRLYSSAEPVSIPEESPKKAAGSKYSTGTGFFITATGIMVTCYHTIKDGKNISVWHEPSQQSYRATVIKTDTDNDLALLKVDNLVSKPVPLATVFAERRGAEVLTLGYPIVDVQGFEQKANFGRVNAGKGYKDDSRFAQVDVPIHPGNSGGPLFNKKGEVVGIIAASLGRKTLEATGTIPQNVAYVVKVDYLWPLLGNIVPGGSLLEPASRKSMDMTEIVAACEDSVMQVLVEK